MDFKKDILNAIQKILDRGVFSSAVKNGTWCNVRLSIPILQCPTTQKEQSRHD